MCEIINVFFFSTIRKIFTFNRISSWTKVRISNRRTRELGHGMYIGEWSKVPEYCSLDGEQKKTTGDMYLEDEKKKVFNCMSCMLEHFGWN